MDRGKRPTKMLGSKNSKIYMDLKDIIREHSLCFLPAKSLFRFRGVCRDWKLQISTPFFAHNQSISFRTISGVFCQTPGNPPSFISIDPKSCGVPDPFLSFLPVPVDIKSSSNGLLCCLGRTDDRAYYICNPVTRQWTKLPKSNADHGHDPAVVLIFEPSLLNFVADYKVVCAFQSSDFDDATEFEIYSSKQGSWKISGEICFGSKRLVPHSGVHVNGVVYWKLTHGAILAFDLTKDRSQLVQNYSGLGGTLGMIDGKLCIASSTGRCLRVSLLANIHTNTMQMSSNARMWEEKHRLSLHAGVLGADARDCLVVMFAGEDLLLACSGRKLYSYDLNTQETNYLCECPNEARCVSYVNSLVSV